MKGQKYKNERIVNKYEMKGQKNYNEAVKGYKVKMKAYNARVERII